MSNDDTQKPRTPRLTTARLGRRSERGVMWGLSGGQLAAVGVAAAVASPAAMSAGPTGLALTAPVWALALGCAFVRPQDRTVVSWAPIVAHHMLRRVRGQRRWLAHPDRPRPGGTLALPGETASMQIHTHERLGRVSK